MSLEVRYLRLSKGAVRPREVVGVYFTIFNKTERNVYAKCVIKVDGVVAREDYTKLIPPYESYDVADFIVAPDRGGSYRVCVSAEVFRWY